MKIEIPKSANMEANEGEMEQPQMAEGHVELIKKAISEIDTNPESAKATLSELLKGEESEVGEPQMEAPEAPKGFREDMKSKITGMMG